MRQQTRLTGHREMSTLALRGPTLVGRSITPVYALRSKDSVIDFSVPESMEGKLVDQNDAHLTTTPARLSLHLSHALACR